jgi:hypothetical protein
MSPAEAILRVLFEAMLNNAKALGQFDGPRGSQHGPSELFSASGSTSVMFALHDLYKEERTAAARPARSEVA